MKLIFLNTFENFSKNEFPEIEYVQSIINEFKYILNDCRDVLYFHFSHLVIEVKNKDKWNKKTWDLIPGYFSKSLGFRPLSGSFTIDFPKIQKDVANKDYRFRISIEAKFEKKKSGNIKNIDEYLEFIDRVSDKLSDKFSIRERVGNIHDSWKSGIYFYPIDSLIIDDYQ